MRFYFPTLIHPITTILFPDPSPPALPVTSYTISVSSRIDESATGPDGFSDLFYPGT